VPLDVHKRSIALWALLAACVANGASDAFAQAISDPVDGEVYDNRATIGVDGYIVDAPNTVTIKMRRLSTGTIQDSASYSVSDDGTGQGGFAVNLDPPELTGWPEDYYIIELWENGSEVANVVIQITSS
jgi:hypothetical protein